MTRRQISFQSIVMIIAMLSIATIAFAEKDLRYTAEDGTIRTKAPEVSEKYLNFWPESQEDAYWQRGQHVLKLNLGKTRTDTTGEHEKWSTPQNILAWIAGTGDKALDSLAIGDQNPADHRHTSGVDYYWSFTLKGQARKFFYFRDLLPADYIENYRKGAKAWTESDVKPSMELILALRSPDEKTRAYALSLLEKMRANLTEEVVEKMTNDLAKTAAREYLASDLAKEDFGADPEKWQKWWQFFSNRGWQAFEEVERVINPRPHPAYGVGTGPVGATWNPNVRGFWADARNTDNLRGMREVAVYLFAEEVGNEEVRRLYKEKIRRTAYGFTGIGMGEWDSEGYHGHSFAAYLNLYDFAQDEQVVGYAKAILDYLTAAGAVKYFHGGWGGPVKRDYGNLSPMSTAAATFFPYFGQYPSNKAKNDLELAFVYTSAYRPPMAIVKMAEKKHSEPYELLNSHPNYENWLPGQAEAPQFYETMFYGRSYQLGTLSKGNDGSDTNGFKMLALNEQGIPEYLVGFTGENNRIGRSNPTVSTVRGDRIGQYRNLVLFTNGQKPNAQFMFYYPKSATVEQDGGWTFIQVHETYIALKPINASEFSTTQVQGLKSKSSAVLVANGKGGDLAGFAMEAGEKASHGSFADFKKAVTSKTKVSSEGKTATLVGSSGDSVKMEWQAALPNLWRNGKPHDFKDHYAVYQPAEGKGPISLGWKEHVLRAEAGGYTFTGTLKEDGTYVTEQSGPGIK